VGVGRKRLVHRSRSAVVFQGRPGDVNRHPEMLAASSTQKVRGRR
jgi:hypothetical protein